MFPQHVEVLTVIEITFLNILNLKKKSYSYTQLSDIFMLASEVHLLTAEWLNAPQVSLNEM